MIEVDGFQKQYAGGIAVDDLTFRVTKGEIVGLVGPNGAGKTTTLRAIAGILPPTRGRIRVAGYDVARDPIEAKKRLAFIPDVAHLFDGLTVWEHLEFAARVYAPPHCQPRADALLERFELDGSRDKLASELSLGMSQKVMICAALLHEPDVLLLDEPLTGLDPRGIRTLYEALEERAAAGAAVMLSTHLLGQIDEFCDRFLIVMGGRRVLEGSLEEIKAGLPNIGGDASLEDVFFHATEQGGGSSGEGAP